MKLESTKYANKEIEGEIKNDNFAENLVFEPPLGGLDDFLQNFLIDERRESRLEQPDFSAFLRDVNYEGRFEEPNHSKKIKALLSPQELGFNLEELQKKDLELFDFFENIETTKQVRTEIKNLKSPDIKATNAFENSFPSYVPIKKKNSKRSLRLSEIPHPDKVMLMQSLFGLAVYEPKYDDFNWQIVAEDPLTKDSQGIYKLASNGLSRFNDYTLGSKRAFSKFLEDNLDRHSLGSRQTNKTFIDEIEKIFQVIFKDEAGIKTLLGNLIQRMKNKCQDLLPIELIKNHYKKIFANHPDDSILKKTKDLNRILETILKRNYGLDMVTFLQELKKENIDVENLNAQVCPSYQPKISSKKRSYPANISKENSYNQKERSLERVQHKKIKAPEKAQSNFKIPLSTIFNFQDFTSNFNVAGYTDNVDATPVVTTLNLSIICNYTALPPISTACHLNLENFNSFKLPTDLDVEPMLDNYFTELPEPTSAFQFSNFYGQPHDSYSIRSVEEPEPQISLESVQLPAPLSSSFFYPNEIRPITNKDDNYQTPITPLIANSLFKVYKNILASKNKEPSPITSYENR